MGVINISRDVSRSLLKMQSAPGGSIAASDGASTKHLKLLRYFWKIIKYLCASCFAIAHELRRGGKDVSREPTSSLKPQPAARARRQLVEHPRNTWYSYDTSERLQKTYELAVSLSLVRCKGWEKKSRKRQGRYPSRSKAGLL